MKQNNIVIVKRGIKYILKYHFSNLWMDITEYIFDTICYKLSKFIDKNSNYILIEKIKLEK